ncbi:AAA family ATPase [Phenylobacterium sp.]|uniref:AAA family ATPase n=1 Tax=Phenylobacterium sp. TaxID=1871053 RepID=UPI003D2C7D6E
MQLNYIKLKNFRQFYGDQVIEFGTDPNKNVTVIHAENGVGKTTLLNAILWAFYERTTNRFEHKDKILNFEAAREGLTTGTVSVGFEHEDDSFVVQRHLQMEGGRAASKLIAQKIVSGVTHSIPAAETFINSVLPWEMARYFFFDGEHAEAFAAQGNQKVVATAVRAMLGCEVADTAVADLKAIAAEFNREAGHVPGNQQLEQLETETARLEQAVANDEAAKTRLTEEIEAWDDQLDKIEAYLRAAEGAKETQRLRDSAAADLRQNNNDIAAADEEVLKWIGGRALNLISRRASQLTLEFVDEAALRGKIPEPYNQPFIQGLLTAQQCICERCLEPGSTHYAAVLALTKTASTAETLKRVIRARSRVSQFKETAGDAAKLLESAQARSGRLHQKRMRLEQTLSELDKKMAEIPSQEIKEREAARVALKAKIADAHRQVGAAIDRIRQAERTLKENEAKVAKLVGQNERAQRFFARRDLARRGQEMLQLLLADYEKSAREQIERSINKVLNSVARREYRFRFGDDFSMELLYPDGHAVPRSGGENQLMSLAFTSALIEYSRLRSGASGEILTPGTVAPLVLDSPFGQLDAKYREATASFVPAMASQVVLLVSSSQGDDTVMRALEPYIGAEYLLVSENKGDRGEKPDDRIVLRNREHFASVYNQPRTLTRIERVH